MTESPLNPKWHREKMTQIIFETFQVSAFYLAIQSVLALYASGLKKGVVLDIGDTTSFVVPIYAGYVLPHAIQEGSVNGSVLTDYMAKLLKERAYVLNATHEKEIARGVKEKLCFVAKDYEYESTQSVSERDYELPDGSVLKIGNERFRCPESLFKPTMINAKGDGVHNMLVDAIIKCDVDIRKELYANVLLTGGSTMFEGIEERIENEITKLAPPSAKIEVIAPPERSQAVWIGGSILASLLPFQNMWVTKKCMKNLDLP